MAKAKLYNQAGEDKGELKLNSKIFDIEANKALIKQVVEAILANRRQVLASAKDRSEVSGGGKKPWKQKGTGRARHGSIRSPLWKGGGVTFGPTKARNFEKKVNKKARTKALFMVLSDKAADENILAIEKMESTDIKTKSVTELLAKISFKTGVVVLPSMDQNIVRAINNLPKVKVLSANSLNVYDTLNAKKILFVNDALKVVENTFLK